MQRQLNSWLLGGTLLGLLVAGLGLHFLHGFQERRSALVWRQQAELALRQEQWAEAARYLHHYLRCWPEDHNALAVYALTLEKAAPTPAERYQAWLLLEQAVRRAPQRDDLRQEAVRLAVSLGCYAEAIHHLEILRPHFKEKTELEYLLGRCHEELGNYTQAAAAYAAVVRQAPQQVEVCLRWARLLYFRLERPTQAIQVLDELVARQPQSVEARLARAHFYREIGDLEQAWADLRTLQTQQPERRDVLLLGAELAQARGDLAAARRFALQGQQHWPNDPYWYGVQAWAAERAGQWTEAAASLRRGLEKDPKNVDLLLNLAAVLGEVGDEAQARVTLERARRAGAAAAVLDTLQAQLLLRQGHWQAARSLLETARLQLHTPSRWQALADLLRAQVFACMGDTLHHLQASQQALAYDPTWPAARLSLAAAWLEMGQGGPALEQLQQLAAGPAPPAALWPLLVRAQLLVELSRPASERRWLAVQATLARAAQAGLPPQQCTLLKAQVLQAQGEWSQAEQLLADACQQHPKDTALWLARADLAIHQHHWQQAQDCLRQAERQGADPPTLLEGWVRYWQARGDRAACMALRELASRAEQLPANTRLRLLRRLASALENLGAAADADRLWARLLQDCPEDQESRFHRLELALHQGQEPLARQLVDELRQHAGEKGFWWRLGQAVYLLARARQTEMSARAPLLAQARQLLHAAAGQQPGISYLSLLLAVTEELAGRDAVAVRHYLEALAAGPLRADILEHTMQLLLASGDLESAEALLQRAAALGPVSRCLARLGTEVALRRQEYPRAEAWARQAVPEDTRDYRDLLWLGQVYAQLGKSIRAEQALRRACELAPRLPEPWLALARHLVSQGKKLETEQLLAEATNRLTGERRWRVLAQGREILGQYPAAEKFYQQWSQAEPDNLSARQALATFYLRQGRPAAAEPILWQLVEMAPQAPPHQLAGIRRQLALCLLARPSAETIAQALALLERNRQLLGPNLEDDLVRARLLAAQPGQRPAALQLLEDWAGKQPLPPEGQQLLARLYDEVGKWLQARATLLALLARQEEPIETLAEYVHLLIRHKEFSEARIYLERLQHLAPHLPQTRQLADLLEQAHPALSPPPSDRK